MEYFVRMKTKNGDLVEEYHFEDFQKAAEFYFKEEPKFHFGKGNGTIELDKEETIFFCN